MSERKRSMDALPEMMVPVLNSVACRSFIRQRCLLLFSLIVAMLTVPALAYQATPGEIELPADSSVTSNDNVERLFHDRNGVLWVATTRGIERFTSLGREQLPSVGGVSAEIASPFAEDGNGGMLFLTTNGLFQWMNGSVHPISLDLAASDAPVAVYRDPQQRVWIGTRTGVYELNQRKSSVPFLWNGGYDAVLHANVHGAVTALSGDAAGNLWIGTNSDGLWRLDTNGLVRATRGEQGSAVSPASATDFHPAPVYKTSFEAWLLYIVLGITGALICAYILRRKMQLMTGRLGIVLEERNRIASECHDTLMAGFAAISWQLEATAKLFKDSGAETTPAAKSCELARSMVSHCQAEARRIIWDLRDTGEVTDVLSQALSRALSAGHLQASIETTLDVEGDEIHLAPGCVHHLVCIGQEAVSNAVRHAQPSKILVNLKFESEALILSIRDNGHGFPTERSISRRGHFGIPVMEERTRKLGGTFRIQTATGMGTEVVVKVAYNALQQPVNQQHHVIRWIGI